MFGRDNWDASPYLHGHLVGWVKEINLDIGRSVVTYTGNDGACHLDVPPSAADPRKLLVDEIVCFRARVSATGQPTAVPPIWKLVGWDGDGDPNDFGRYQGEVGSLLGDGSGVVVCQGLKSKHGSDAHVQPNVAAECELVVGDALVFDVALDDLGQPQLLAPVWKRCERVVRIMPGIAETSSQERSFLSIMNGKDGRNGMHMQEGLAPSPDAICVARPCQGENGRACDQPAPHWNDGLYIGLVKNVDVASGSSTILCPDSEFECGICAHRDVISPTDLSLEDVVAFKTNANGTNMPTAACPFWKLTGWNHVGDPAQFGDYCGRVQLVTSNGSGVVYGAAVDVDSGVTHIPASVMDACSIAVGSLIAFNLTVDVAGKREVLPPVWVCWNEGVSKAAAPRCGAEARDDAFTTDCGEMASRPLGGATGTGEAWRQSPAWSTNAITAGTSWRTGAWSTDVSSGATWNVAPSWGHNDSSTRESPGITVQHIAGASGTGVRVKAVSSEGARSPADTALAAIASAAVLVGYAWCTDETVLAAVSTNGVVHNYAGHGEIANRDATSDAANAGKVIGTVRTVDKEREMIMVACDEGYGYPSDVIVHPSATDNLPLVINDVVSFDVFSNEEGKPQAKPPVWKLVGWNGKETPHFGRYVGMVSRVLPNGCGFLVCPEVKDLHGTDVYIHITVMSWCELVAGDVIWFNLHISRKGRPQLSAPCWKCCSKHERTQELVLLVSEEEAKLSPAPYALMDGKAPTKMLALADGDVCTDVSTSIQHATLDAGKHPAAPPERLTSSTAGLVGAPPAWLPEWLDKVGKKGNQPQTEADGARRKVLLPRPQMPAPVQELSITRDVGGAASSTAPPTVAQAASTPSTAGVQAATDAQDVGSAEQNGNEGEDAAELKHAGSTQKTSVGKAVVADAKQVDSARTALNEENDMSSTVAGRPKGQGPEVGADETPSKFASMPAPWSQASGAWTYDRSAVRASTVGACVAGRFSNGVRAKPATSPFDVGSKVSRGTGMQPPVNQKPSRKSCATPSEKQSSAAQNLDSAEQKDSEAANREDEQTHIGSVSVTDEIGGFTLVKCPYSGFSRDVFVHSSIADPEVLAPKDIVAFKVQGAKDGKPKAISPFWKLMGLRTGTEAPKEFGKFQGTISHTRDAHGGATVESEALREVRGADAYIRSSIMSFCSLFAGDTIAFNLFSSSGSSPQVAPPVWRLQAAGEEDADVPPATALVDCVDVRKAGVEPTAARTESTATRPAAQQADGARQKVLLPRPQVPAPVQEHSRSRDVGGAASSTAPPTATQAASTPSTAGVQATSSARDRGHTSVRIPPTRKRALDQPVLSSQPQKDGDKPRPKKKRKKGADKTRRDTKQQVNGGSVHDQPEAQAISTFEVAQTSKPRYFIAALDLDDDEPL